MVLNGAFSLALGYYKGTWRKCKLCLNLGPYTFEANLGAHFRYNALCLLGPKSKFSCPRCLVPKESIYRLSQTFPARTKRKTCLLFNLATNLSRTRAKKFLKSRLSMHFAQVCINTSFLYNYKRYKLTFALSERVFSTAYL
jgi:hypothetical protein